MRIDCVTESPNVNGDDQESIRSDSIVAYFYSTASPRRLLQHNLPGPDSCNAAKTWLFDHLVGASKALAFSSLVRPFNGSNSRGFDCSQGYRRPWLPACPIALNPPPNPPPSFPPLA